MKMSITFIGRLCLTLADTADRLVAAQPTLAVPLGRRSALRDDATLLGRAWSDMAIRNVLADLLRTIKALQTGLTSANLAANASAITTASRGVGGAAPPLTGRNRSGALSGTDDLGPAKAMCRELIARIETELKQHSPSRARYSHVVCLGYKIKLPGDAYRGEVDDEADMLAKCRDMKAAIIAAYSLADRDARLHNLSTNTLKVFVAPEFFFRGRNGAYDHAVVHGGDVKKGVLNQLTKTRHKGLAEILREEIGKPCYRDWLFVLGTAIAATKLTETACLQPGCTGAIAFDKNARTGKTTPKCTVNAAHKVGEKVSGAQVENVALIFKEGEFHTVTKELVSGIDYIADRAQNKRNVVTVRGEELDVVRAPQASGYNAASQLPTKFSDERMGGCIFTIDGITIGVEVCLDHAATTGSDSAGRLNHAGNIQLQLIPSAGMNISSMSTVDGGIIFNVDAVTPHVEVIGGDTMTVKSTKYDGWEFTPTDRLAVNWSGSDLEKLDKLQNLGRGAWNNTGVAAASAAAGRGSVVLYGPYALPRV